MTIRARVRGGAEQPLQPTASSEYYQQLADRFEQQAATRVPRSSASWGAEQARLGSWESGVGSLHTSGRGPGRPNGAADPRFNYSLDEED